MQQNNAGGGNQNQQSPESLMDDSYFGEIRSFMGKVMNSANTGENQQNRNSAAAVVAAVNRNHNISDILSKTSANDSNANPLDVIQKLYPLFGNAWKTMNAKMNGSDPVDKSNCNHESDKNDNSLTSATGSTSNKKLENGSIDGGSEATIAEDEEEDEDEDDVDEDDIVDEGTNSDGSTAAGSGGESELDVESASPQTISSIPKDDMMIEEDDDDDDEVRDNNENDDLDDNLEKKNKKRKRAIETNADEEVNLSKEDDKGVITEEEDDIDGDQNEKNEHSNSKADCVTVNGDGKGKGIDGKKELGNGHSNIGHSSRKRSKKELTKTNDDLMV